MRIDKFLANLKYGSRTDIKALISQERITSNGEPVADPGKNIDPEIDRIEVDRQPVFYRKWIYLMLNKPQGVVSANADSQHKTILDLIGEPYSRFSLDLCGRLDLDTEGLILLTNDGDLLHQITSPKKDIGKTYEVTLKHPLGDGSSLETGVQILDGKDQPYVTRPAKLIPISDFVCRIIISEGKFHQVKRMFEAIGHEVTALKRLSIGGLVLDPKLPPGMYKELSFAEVQTVFRKKSRKTPDL